MAAAKISALTAGASLLDTDILPCVTDPGGTPATKKITLANLRSCIATGSATNDAAAAGKVGEYLASLVVGGSAVNLGTNGGNVTSLSLTAGDWDVEGAVTFFASGATVTQRVASINTVSGQALADGSEGYNSVGGSLVTVPVSRKRISVATTTTIYLVASVTFTGGVVLGYGNLTARRMR